MPTTFASPHTVIYGSAETNLEDPTEPVSEYTVGEHGPEQIVRTDEVIGQSDGQPRSVPNQADAAFEELERLRAEACSLGLEINERWPLAILREEVAQAKARR